VLATQSAAQGERRWLRRQPDASRRCLRALVVRKDSMDIKTLLIPGLVLVALAYLLFSNRSMKNNGEPMPLISDAENAIRQFFKRLETKSIDPTVPLPVRAMCSVLFALSMYIWIAIVTVAVTLIFFGKYLRPVLRAIF
jgi:hypothetical protein